MVEIAKLYCVTVCPPDCQVPAAVCTKVTEDAPQAALVGAEVGAVVGALVGAVVGAEVEGALVGALVGAEVGAVVGALVAALVGAAVGAAVGAVVGAVVEVVVAGTKEMSSIQINPAVASTLDIITNPDMEVDVATPNEDTAIEIRVQVLVVGAEGRLTAFPTTVPLVP